MEFIKRATQITFTNQDGDNFIIRECNDDADILEFHIREESFWIRKVDVNCVAQTIVTMADS